MATDSDSRKRRRGLALVLANGDGPVGFLGEIPCPRCGAISDARFYEVGIPSLAREIERLGAAVHADTEFVMGALDAFLRGNPGGS
jgi:hypothetical protein